MATIDHHVETGATGQPNKAPGTASGDSDGQVLHDVVAYRIAVGAVGAALVMFLLGASVIVAAGKTVPQEYWTVGSAVSGALLGILVPPTPKPTVRVSWWAKAAAWLWANRAVLILLAIFAVSVIYGIREKSTQLQALAGATGGALIGLLAPSPRKA
jgi:hypothetical protein